MSSLSVDGGGLVKRFISLLPMLLSLLVVMGIILYAATRVLPEWQEYQTLAANVEAGKQQLDTLDDGGDMLRVLSSQVEQAQSELDSSAALLLTSAQADDLLNRLYGYAQESSVTVTLLEAVVPTPARNETPMPSTAYETRTFQLQVEGEVNGLLNFVMHLREASQPGVSLDNIRLGKTATGTGALLLNLRLYVSPFASGDALANLPTAEVMAAAFPTATLAASPAADTQVVAAAATPIPNGAGIEPTVDVPDVIATSTTCSGAPESIFQAGDSITVDFTGSGALRVLVRPVGSIDILDQAYDGETMQLLDGPVCGVWEGAHVWYWHVDFQGIQGWAAEGDTDDRWMCPISNPECS